MNTSGGRPHEHSQVNQNVSANAPAGTQARGIMFIIATESNDGQGAKTQGNRAEQTDSHLMLARWLRESFKEGPYHALDRSGTGDCHEGARKADEASFGDGGQEFGKKSGEPGQ